MKHNKKRNTAFLYEVLMREGAKASLEKNLDKLKIIKSIILEFFHPDSALGYELSLYSALKLKNDDEKFAQKILNEVKTRHSVLNRRVLFNEQTNLITKINKCLGSEIYENFVPNYKDLATIYQIFNDSTPIKEKVLLEEAYISSFKDKNTVNEQLKPIDTIVYKTFVKKFNDKYSSLLKEQKDLLTKYVSSFGDDGLELKLYLNEEIDRLNNKINEAMKKEDIKSDRYMFDKTNKLLDLLKTFKENKTLTSEMLENVLKIQQFIHEVEN
jgi:hypothetical protein